MNKIIPLRPAVVVLMTGTVDFDVALFQASFWSNDCWIEPIFEIGQNNQLRDPNKRLEPLFRRSVADNGVVFRCKPYL